MDKKEIGFLILLSLIFGILGFMAAYAANFLWWYNTHNATNEKIYSHGIYILILFSLMILVLIFLAQRYLRDRIALRFK